MKDAKIDSFTRFWLLLCGLNPFWGKLFFPLESILGRYLEHNGAYWEEYEDILEKIRSHFGKETFVE